MGKGWAKDPTRRFSHTNDPPETTAPVGPGPEWWKGFYAAVAALRAEAVETQDVDVVGRIAQKLLDARVYQFNRCAQWLEKWAQRRQGKADEY